MSLISFNCNKFQKKKYFHRQHYTSHQDSVQEARRKATERLQQSGADEAYINEFASGSGAGSRYRHGSSGFGGAGFGGVRGSGASAGLTSANGGDPALCTVPCDR